MVRKRTFVQLYYKAMWFQNKIEMVRKRTFVQLYQQGDVVSIPFLSRYKYASPKGQLRA